MTGPRCWGPEAAHVAPDSTGTEGARKRVRRLTHEPSPEARVAPLAWDGWLWLPRRRSAWFAGLVDSLERLRARVAGSRFAWRETEAERGVPAGDGEHVG